MHFVHIQEFIDINFRCAAKVSWAPCRSNLTCSLATTAVGTPLAASRRVGWLGVQPLAHRVPEAQRICQTSWPAVSGGMRLADHPEVLVCRPGRRCP